MMASLHLAAVLLGIVGLLSHCHNLPVTLELNGATINVISYTSAFPTVTIV